jgi:hypothetical protein
MLGTLAHSQLGLKQPQDVKDRSMGEDYGDIQQDGKATELTMLDFAMDNAVGSGSYRVFPVGGSMAICAMDITYRHEIIGIFG